MTYNYDDKENDYYSETVESEVGHDDKKKKRPFKKTVAIVALVAVLFGAAAGGGYYVAGNILNNNGNSKQAVSYNDSSEDSNEDVDTQIQKVSVDSNTVSVYDVSGVVENTLPSIVAVNCYQYVSSNYSQYSQIFGYNYNDNSNNDNSANSKLQQSSTASGVIIGENDETLYLITNYHVVEGADVVEVKFNDDSSIKANVKGYDSDADLAVLEIAKSDIPADTKNAIKIAKIGDSEDLMAGEAVIAIGNAMGYGQSVTTGVLSAVNREIQLTDTTMVLLQTDAAINPGNSGGALLNSKGELIGVNTVKFASSEIEGMGYAIPISKALPIVDSIMNKEDIPENEQGFLGIVGRDIDSQVQKAYSMPAGVYVVSVNDNTPASAAGIVAGSIITKFDGKEVTSMEKLSEMIKSHRAGETVTMTLMIADKGQYVEKEISVTLASKGEAE